jgi:hypothetical protein
MNTVYIKLVVVEMVDLLSSSQVNHGVVGDRLTIYHLSRFGKSLTTLQLDSDNNWLRFVRISCSKNACFIEAQ